MHPTKPKLALACLLLTSAFARAQSPTLHNDPAHPAHATHWVTTQLYFGLGSAGKPSEGVTEAAWQDFLDTEVTPRFPAGLSVMEVYGQWQGLKAPIPSRIRSKLLMIAYPVTSANIAKVEAIRQAWKRRTGDQSVLRITQPAEISF